MKQHITLDQLNELSEEGKEKLRKMFPCDHAHCVCGHKFDAHEPLSHPYLSETEPLLSIGQMIEFISEKEKDIHLERTDMGRKGLWGVSTCYDHEADGVKWGFKEKEYAELCDALWEAVKEILK